jgi:hypothetical protein
VRAAYEWITGGDTGASSKAIWAHMMGVKSDGSYPYDPSDFGRCYRLLCLVPEWRGRMPEMARYGTIWSRLVTQWDEITRCFEEEVGCKGQATYNARGNALRTYDLILQCRGEAPRHAVQPSLFRQTAKVTP